MSLTESKVRQAKPGEKIYFLADDDGLSLKIEPNGTKSWSYRFSVPGSNKRSRIKLGVYPDMSLKEARAERDERKLTATQPHRANKKILYFCFHKWQGSG